MAKTPKITPVEKTIKEDGDVDGGTTAAPMSKTAMISQAVNIISAMQGDEGLNAFQETFGSIGSEAANIPDDAAARNAATIAMKGALKEDMNQLFGSEELSEEFRDKATTLFESALSARLVLEKEALSEQFEAQLNEQVEEIQNGLVEAINDYITHAAKSWLEENQVAIESTLRNEISEEVMSDIRDVLIAHNIDIPENKVDVVEELTATVEQLKGELNETHRKNIDLEKALSEAARADIIERASADMTLDQAAKLQVLVEDVDAINNEEFANKVMTIKENLSAFTSTARRKTTLLVESDAEDASIDGSDSNEKKRNRYTDPTINQYVHVASLMSKSRR